MALRSLFKKDVVEAELDKEMRFHLEMQTQYNIEKGMDPSTAKREALRSFGGFDKFKEESREAWGVRVVTDLMRDIRYSFHSLWKGKGFSLAVIVTLALCIGANTTVLSALYGLVLKPLPFENPDRLVQVFNIGKNNPIGGHKSGSGWFQYLDFKKHADLLEGVAVAKSITRIIKRGDSYSKSAGNEISADFFDLLGVKPLLGRFFESDEIYPMHGQFVVLTQTSWENDYNGDPDVIGKEIHLDVGNRYTIVGIAPRSVESLYYEGEFFIPYRVRPNESRYGGGANLWVRLKGNVSHAACLDHLRSLERRWYQEEAGARGRSHADAVFESLELDMDHPLKESLTLLEAGALFFFLVGCLNIFNLFLRRAGHKCHELSIRNALGANKALLRRSLLVESALLTMVAAIIGFCLAWGGLYLINGYVRILDPSAIPLDFDLEVLVLVIAISCSIALLLGFLPLELLWRAGLLQQLDSSQRSSSASSFTRKLSDVLVVGQVAFAFALLIGAMLLFRSFNNVLSVDPGFEATRVIKGRIDDQSLLPFYKRSATAALKQRIAQGMRELPGVESVCLSQYESFKPYNGENTRYILSRGVSLDTPRMVERHLVTPDYFDTMGIRILEGRRFNLNDIKDSVYIVDESFARHFDLDESPLGSDIHLGQRPPQSGKPWSRIVGVSKRANLRDLEQRDGLPVIYTVLPRDYPSNNFTIFLRSSRPPGDVVRDMRSKLREIDARLVLSKVGTLQNSIDEMLLDRKGITVLASSFAGLSLLLSLLGIYALLAYDVSSRRREIGVRSAIGASRISVLKMILHQGFGKAGLGLGIGLLASLYLTRFLESMLFDVAALDPWTYISVILIFISVALVASYLPARRAVGVDPLEALRAE